jgi:hypothetical protein
VVEFTVKESLLDVVFVLSFVVIHTVVQNPFVLLHMQCVWVQIWSETSCLG